MTRHKPLIRVGVVLSLLTAVGCGMAAVAAPPEVAPPPREVKLKAKAELLVGTWRMTMRNGVTYPDARIKATTTFTADGKITTLLEAPNPRPLRRGTYQFDGTTITYAYEASEEVKADTVKAVVKTVTERELVMLIQSLGTDYQYEFRRIKDIAK